MLLDKPLLQVTEDDLQALCDNRVLESKTVDYKGQLSLDSEKDKDDFRADLCSFANTIGGDIIFGIPEKDSMPLSVDGLADPNPDKVKQRLENVRGARIEPLLAGVNIHPIKLRNGRWCFVVRTDKSWTPPHAVVRSDCMRAFWGRHSTGKHPLDLPGIRTALNLGYTRAERIRTFRIDRINKINAGDTPTPVGSVGKLVYHLIPLDAFETNPPYDLVSFYKSGGANCLARDWAHTFRYNLDGLLGHTLGAPNEFTDGATPSKYVQVFRNGIVEAVDAKYFCWPGTIIEGPHLDGMIVDHVGYLLDSLKRLNARLPAVLFVTILGALGHTIRRGKRDLRESYELSPIDRDILPLPEVILQEHGEKPEALLKPVLDALWQSAGWERSMTYTDTGEWQAP